MFLDPGAARELHWHAIAAEWAYVIDGHCQTMVLDPSGASEINNFGPGDLWYFARGHGHSIQTIGDKPCHFILSFDNGAFSEHGTFGISDWINVTPKEMLALDFGLPKDVFDAFPKGEIYIQSGPNPEAGGRAGGPVAEGVDPQVRAADENPGRCAISTAGPSAWRRSTSSRRQRPCRAAS